jgi:hypothetical protein
MEERKIIMTEEEEMRWFFSEVLDGVTLEMSKGVYKVIFSYSNKKKKYELRIYRENNVLFASEAAFWETPIRMLEGHVAFLKMVARALRKVSFFEELEKARREKREEEQEEEKEESEE